MVASDSGVGFAPIDNNGSVITTKDAPHPIARSSNSGSTSSTSTSTSSTSTSTSSTSTGTTNSDSDAVVAANNDSKKTSSSSSSSFRLVRYLSDLPNWQSYNDSQEHFIQQMPKIELHVHLDGSFDPDFLWRYMQEHPNSVVECLPCQAILPWENNKNKTLPVRKLVQDCTSSKDYHKLCTCRGHRSLKQMLNCFEIFLPLVRRNLSLLEQLAFDFCQRQYEQNVVYTEVRYSPFLLAEGFVDDNNNDNDNDKKQQQNDEKNNENENNIVVDGAAVLKAITTGLRRGSHKFNIVVNQILCAITWRPDWAQPTLDLVLEHWHDYPCATVGIDIAAGEEHFDAKNFAHLHDTHYQVFYNKAQSLDSKYKDIPVTIHAGESPDESSSDNVRRAVEEYGASRIGHGYRVVKDIALMEQLRRGKIHLEVCPTSSDETGGWVYSDPPPSTDNNGGDDDDDHKSKPQRNKNKKQWMQHPIVDMLKAGLSFSFSSDDPAVFHTSLAWQYRVAMVKMSFTREQMLQCNLNAIDAAFCSVEEKEKLRRHLLDFAAFSGFEYVAATATTTDGERGTDKKFFSASTSPQNNEQQQHYVGDKGTWRRTSTCAASTTASSSIHRAHHTAADSSLLPSSSTTSTTPQWKRSMSANFVDRVYVYKPGGGADNKKEYEYL